MIKANISQWFEYQVEQMPKAVALSNTGRYLTYLELNERANRIAWTLIQKGVNSESVVGLMLNRSTDLIASILGILKAGAAYLPLDPIYPTERLQYMLQNSGATTFITQEELFVKKRINITNINYINISDDYNLNTQTHNPPVCVKVENLAYIIYTSGSTGLPKGVAVEHCSVLNLFQGLPQVIPFKQGKIISSLASISFDIFVAETLLPLVYGLCVVLATEEEQASPEALQDMFSREKVNIIQSTPSRIRWILEDEGCSQSLKNIEIILIGGECFPLALLKQLNYRTEAKIFNLYGPTEATVWTSAKELFNGEQRITIGKPFQGIKYYIIKRQGGQILQANYGELCIAGHALARGYIGCSELTDKKFLNNPFEVGQRMYQTGDLARVLNNGDIEIIGRQQDEQVKINGYRIELGEIETILSQFKDVKAVVVLACELKGEQIIVAYIIPSRLLQIKSLKQFAQRYLPFYMIPSVFKCVYQFPLTPNGKVDRDALRRLPLPQFFVSKSISPLRYIQTLVSHLCGEEVSIYTDILDLGFDSLSILRLASSIHSHFGVRLTLRELLKSRNLEEICLIVKQKLEESNVPVEAVSIDKFAKEDYDLSSNQCCYFATFMPFGNSSACNIQKNLEVQGTMDDERIIQGIAALVAQNDSMRCIFVQQQETIYQRFLQEDDFDIEQAIQIINLHTVKYEQQKVYVESILAELAATEISLDKWPLFKLLIIHLSDTLHMIALQMHHLISDGKSLDILQCKLEQICLGENIISSTQALGGYRHYVQVQGQLKKTRVYQEDRNFWLSYFSDLSEPTQFPVCTDISDIGGHSCGYIYELEDSTIKGVQRVARELRCSTFVIMLSAYILLICEELKRESLAISVPIENRYDENLVDVIGLFATLGLVYQHCNSDKTICELIYSVDEQLMGLQTHTLYQYHDLLNDLGCPTATSRLPITSIMFNSEFVSSSTIKFIQKFLRQHLDLGRIIRFDLQAFVQINKDITLVEWIYRTDILSAVRIEEIAQRYKVLLDNAFLNVSLKIGSVI